MKTKIIILLTILNSGCAIMPFYVDGRRVIGTTWVDGKRVFILESSKKDREITKQAARESQEAAAGIVFVGTLNK